MKKIIAFVLAALMVLSLCACGKKAGEASPAPAQASSPASAPASSGKAESSTAAKPAAELPQSATAEPAKTENAPSTESVKVPDVIDAEFLSGAWKASVDITDKLSTGILDEMKDVWSALGVEDYAQYVSIRPASLYIDLSLDKSGSFTRSVDSGSVKAVVENFAQDVVDTHVRVLEVAFQRLCEENGITIEELYEQAEVSDIYALIELVMEMSLDEYRDTIVDSAAPELEASLSQFSVSGEYTVSGSSLTFSYDGASEGGSFDAGTNSISIPLGIELKFFRV